MNDFLTKISGQIAGPIVQGAFIPVVLFITALILVVLPITPYVQPLENAVNQLKIWEDKATAAIILTLVVTVLSLILYSFNIPIIRLYEGYPWQKSWIGGWSIRQERSRYQTLADLRGRIREFRQDLRVEKVKVDIDGLVTAQGRLAKILNFQYPNGSSHVLPTRFGNVVRSFETYPLARYGISLINVWPRLQGVIPVTYAQGLEGAKTSVDFMVNCSFLSAVLAVILAIAGLRWQHPLLTGVDRAWMIWVLIFLVFSRLFYYGATNRAAEWGAQVRAAFDLYRGLLIAQLGYEVKPNSIAEEKRIWENINYRFAFPDDGAAPDLPYRKRPTTVDATPDIVLSVDRTVSMLPDGSTRVKIVVENTDAYRLSASEVQLSDDIGRGLALVDGTAKVDGVPATLLSVNPLQLRLGPLAAGKQKVLTYQVKKP